MDETSQQEWERVQDLYPWARDQGNCFQVAYHLGVIDHGVLDVNEDKDEVRIVHGLPMGRGRVNQHKRFWHGWVEVTRKIEVPAEVIEAHPEFAHLASTKLELVIDWSNGQHLTLPRAAYYNMGELDEEHIWRFTSDEARHELLERGHYGPWVDDWEEMEE